MTVRNNFFLTENSVLSKYKCVTTYDHKVLALDEFVECVRYIESYAFRRLVCWIPTNSMNKTFARFSVGLKKDRYVESFKAKFLLLTGNRRMPMDSEFEHNLQNKDMYNM